MLRARLLQLAWWAGLWRPPDRRLLEDVILPACGAGGGPVLFVGVRFYTRNYASRCGGAEFVTLDRDPAMRRHGARSHAVAPLEELGRHFPAGHFTHIVVNGVFGWGLDEPGAADRALAACHAALRPGGWLVLGEDLTTSAVAGIALTAGGVLLAIVFGKRRAQMHEWEKIKGPLIVGVLLGLGAAVGRELRGFGLQPDDPAVARIAARSLEMLGMESR